MTFKDILKDSFLKNYELMNLETVDILIIMGITALLALYMFFIYRFMTRKGFYNKAFNIALPAVALITAAIIITIQSSVIVSLGMVGALSIVRFRTAIKDPLDLVFMFWAISIGIICGAGLHVVALIVSIIVTAAIYLLDLIPAIKDASILVVQTNDNGMENAIKKKIDVYAKHYRIKSRNMTVTGMDMVVELSVKEGDKLLKDICALEGVENVSLLDHDGEVTF